MVKQKLSDLVKELKEQEEQTYGDESVLGGTAGGADPMDIDEAVKKATGATLDEKDELEIADEIDFDEKNVTKGTPPIGSNVDEKETEEFGKDNEVEDDLEEQGFHIVDPDNKDSLNE